MCKIMFWFMKGVGNIDKIICDGNQKKWMRKN